MKGRAYVDWTRGPAWLADQVDDWWAQTKQRIPAELEMAGSAMRAFAVANHPWQNQTGQAERELGYQVRTHGKGFELVFYQGAPHGIWLEVRWAGHWGIIPRTMTTGYPLVMQAVMRAMRG